MSRVDRFFEDKHTICAILLVWMLLISFLFAGLGASHIQFFTFGPSPKTSLMGVKIDAWWKWTCVSVLTFLNTLCTEYVYDCFAPWIMTTVVDHKGGYIPYPKRTMLYFVIVSSTYRTLIQVVMLYIMLSQIDFLLVRVIADLVVTVLTTQHFLRYKIHDPVRYAEEQTGTFTAMLQRERTAASERRPSASGTAAGSTDALLST